MATHFGGMGVTPIEDSRVQEPDNISESESQDEDPLKQVLSGLVRQHISDNS